MTEIVIVFVPVTKARAGQSPRNKSGGDGSTLGYWP